MIRRILRDSPATAIPPGDPVPLTAGQEVAVVQSLGGNVTVRTERGLFRVGRDTHP